MLGHGKPSLEKEHENGEKLNPLKSFFDKLQPKSNLSALLKKQTKIHVPSHLRHNIRFLHEAHDGLGDMIRKSFFYQTDNLSSVPPPHTNPECLTCDS